MLQRSQASRHIRSHKLFIATTTTTPSINKLQANNILLQNMLAGGSPNARSEIKLIAMSRKKHNHQFQL